MITLIIAQFPHRRRGLERPRTKMKLILDKSPHKTTWSRKIMIKIKLILPRNDIVSSDHKLKNKSKNENKNKIDNG